MSTYSNRKDQSVGAAWPPSSKYLPRAARRSPPKEPPEGTGSGTCLQKGNTGGRKKAAPPLLDGFLLLSLVLSRGTSLWMLKARRNKRKPCSGNFGGRLFLDSPSHPSTNTPRRPPKTKHLEGGLDFWQGPAFAGSVYLPCTLLFFPKAGIPLCSAVGLKHHLFVPIKTPSFVGRLFQATFYCRGPHSQTPNPPHPPSRTKNRCLFKPPASSTHTHSFLDYKQLPAVSTYPSQLAAGMGQVG